MAAMREPPKSVPPAEETGDEEDLAGADSLSEPGAQKKAGALLRARRMVGKTVKKVATKAAVETVKMAGRAQKFVAALARTSGSSLISLGMGFGVTLVGLVFGLPLILFGLVLFIAGILGMITAEATMAAARAAKVMAEVQAKAAEAKEEGGGGVLSAGGTAIAETAKTSLRLILTPLEMIGCTAVGLFGGFFIMIAVAIAVILLAPDMFPGGRALADALFR